MKLRRGLSRFITHGTLLSAILLLPWGQPAAAGATAVFAASRPSEKSDRKAETARILPVLEERIGDPAVLAKTKAKLFTLQVEEILLISSLCDRISAGERTVRTEVAFSLVTALIVLS